MTSSEDESFRFAGFELALGRGGLRRGEQEIPLRPKSLTLLHYMLRRAGRILSKDELMSAVWPDVIVTEDSLTQCIHDIRRALGADARTLLRTVPRRGYLLSADIEMGAPGVASGGIPELSSITASSLPRLAVLPFDYLGDTPHEQYFADGFLADLTSALSRFRRLFVISPDSTLTYRSTRDRANVAAELAVGYLVDGKIQRHGNRLRVSARLVDAETRAVLWSEHFDDVIDGVFDVQDRLAAAVVGALTPRLLTAEIERARRSRTGSPVAYDLYLRAVAAVRKMTRAENDLALSLTARALELDPEYAVAAGLGGWAYSLRVAQGWRMDEAAERVAGMMLARRAATLGAPEEDAEALAMGGYTIAFLGEQLSEGLRLIELGTGYNPNFAQGHAFAGWVRAYLGEAEGAKAAFQRALSLSPRDPGGFRALSGLAFAHLLAEDHLGAARAARSALDQNPFFTPAHRALATALAHLGRLDEARATIDALLAIRSDLTVSSFARESLFRHSGGLEMILDGLRRAGLPE